MIRVVIVDDHPMFREGVATVLTAEGDIEVVGQAGSVKEARKVIPQHEPDVVLMDVTLPDGDGADIIPEFRKLKSRFIVLTLFGADRVVLRVLGLGAMGYVVKESEPAVLRTAIREVASGAKYLDSRIAGKVVKAATKGGRPKGPFGLTNQEMRVLGLLPRKLTNREIGSELSVSEETVKTHLRHALKKLALDDRTSAARFVIENGLITP
ncbi:MAG: response regulator transcription factor [Actinobacteria bacterium]|nr:response regulator transcription factor [Actinomycetota bacterium]